MNLHEKHKDEISFLLRLRHKSTRLILGDTGLINKKTYGLAIGCGYAGMSKEDVFSQMSEVLSRPAWLLTFSSEDFEIESDLA